MKKTVFSILLVVSAFFLVSCTRVSLDPPLPAIVDESMLAPEPDSMAEPGRLLRAETTVMKGDTRSHTTQYYEYQQGQLSRVYAPEGLLAARSEIPHIWDLVDMEIREVEETYYYEEDRLIRLEGRKPEELGGGGYVISFWYEDDHVVRELLLVDDEIISLDLEYDGSLLVRGYCSTGSSISYSYNEDGSLYIVSLSDNGISSKFYDYIETSVLKPLRQGDEYAEYAFADGVEAKITCISASRPYTEQRQYDMDGRLLSASRDYANGETVSTRYYYS